MVARRYSRTRKQKGGGKQPKIGRFSKIVAAASAVPHYITKAAKGTAIGTAAIVAAPVAAGVSIAKAGTVAAATAAISTPTRLIQGAIKTPWQLARLGVQKGKEWSARRKLTAAGMHNYENLKQRVSKRTQTLNTLREQKSKLNEQKLQQNLSGTGSRLSSWWKGKQIARKEKAIANATTRLEQSIDHKATRTNTTIASTPQNISEKAKKFIAGLNTTKKRQIAAFDTNLQKKRNEKAQPIQEQLKILGDTHKIRQSHKSVEAEKNKAFKDLEASRKELDAFKKPQILPNGDVKIGDNTYTRDNAITAAKTLREQIKTQTAILTNATTAFNKSAKSVAALDAEVAKLQKQKDAYMSQGKTADQLYGSFQRRKARVQKTKKELGNTAQQLTGIATIKNIGRAVGTSFQQNLRLAQKAIKTTTGIQLGQNTATSNGTKPVKSPGVLAAIGKSLTSSKNNLSSRYTAIKHGIEPIVLKIKTLWSGYVNNFSKQGKLLDKFEKDVSDEGILANDAKAIIEAYKKVEDGKVIPPELRERHQAFINKREIMTNFANLIAKNRSTAPDPNKKIFDESSRVKQGAINSGITLPINDPTDLDANIKTVVSNFNQAKDYPSQMMYKELYNHLKSIKRWNESAEFGNKATTLITKLNALLPGLDVLPESKPKSAPPHYKETEV